MSSADGAIIPGWPVVSDRSVQFLVQSILADIRTLTLISQARIRRKQKEGGITELPPNLSRRARSPDPARAKRVLGESRGRASLDSCARRDSKDAGNPA
jgi:hypothetical protein